MVIWVCKARVFIQLSAFAASLLTSLRRVTPVRGREGRYVVDSIILLKYINKEDQRPNP